MARKKYSGITKVEYRAALSNQWTEITGMLYSSFNSAYWGPEEHIEYADYEIIDPLQLEEPKNSEDSE